MTTEEEARELVKAAYRPGEDFLSAAIHIITAALAQRDEAREQFDLHVAWASDQELKARSQALELYEAAMQLSRQSSWFQGKDEIVARLDAAIRARDLQEDQP